MSCQPFQIGSFFPQEHLTFTKKADAQTVLLQAEGNFDWLAIGITYHKIQPIIIFYPKVLLLQSSTMEEIIYSF